MKYITGDIWQIAEQANGWIVIPTNTMIRTNGTAVMGKGMAKEAANRYPELPTKLGNHIYSCNERIYVNRPIVCLPTKRDWREESKLEYIEKGCRELLDMFKIMSSVGHDNDVFLPTLGCGLGGLNWEREVRPVMDSILDHDRFILVQQ